MRELKAESPKWLFSAGALVVVVVLPFMIGKYYLSVLTLIWIWAIATVGLNILFGYTGLLSLGHSAFIGIGAYAFGLLTVKAGLAFWPSFLLAVIISGMLGFLIGIPSLRAKGQHFVLVSLGFGIIVSVVSTAWTGLTGGSRGFAGVPRPTTIPLLNGAKLSFTSTRGMYYFVLIWLVIALLICYRIVKSRIGKTFVAIKHDEILVRTLGTNVFRNKLLSFTLSAMFAGLAGVLYASYNAVLSPDISGFFRSVELVAYLLVGGAGYVFGPVIGSLVLVAIPEILQVVPELRVFIFGIILALFIIFLPGGIAGLSKRLVAKALEKRRGVGSDKHGAA